MTEFQIIVGIIGLLGGVLIVLFILDIYFSAKEKKKESISLGLSKEFIFELEKIIEKEIRKNASEINQKIITEIGEIYKETVSSLNQRTQKKLMDFDETFKNEIIKIFNASTQAQNYFLKEAKESVERYNKILQENINEIYRSYSKNINEKILKTEQEIENFKKEKLKEVEKKIFQLVTETTKKILGKTIDISTHEELVLEALEKAKKEGFF